jgi:hypothetical protein
MSLLIMENPLLGFHYQLIGMVEINDIPNIFMVIIPWQAGLRLVNGSLPKWKTIFISNFLFCKYQITKTLSHVHDSI